MGGGQFRGFVLIEVLILSTVMVGTLIFMYSQFKNINRSYQRSFKYDTVEGMYLANNFVNYINEGVYETLILNLNNSSLNYLDITDCNINYFSSSSYCEKLVDKSKIEKIIFTKEDLIDLKQNMNDLTDDFIDYINTIKVSNVCNDYRIIVKYHDGTFATMRFNKGDIYASEGMIVYLDAINNVGNGHSDTTSIWRDLSGNGNDATLYNNPKWNNNSIVFDGETNYGLINNTKNMEFLDGFTIETRVKVLSLTGYIETEGFSIFGNWQNGGSGIVIRKNGKLSSSVHFNNTYNYLDTNINFYKYYTIAITYDNLCQMVYVNGILVASMSYDDISFVTKSTVPFGIAGNPKTNGVSSYANVEFQSIRMYNKSLNDEQIYKNYLIDENKYYEKKSTVNIGYVLDDVVTLLDGIDNTLNGHMNNADKWYDLSGNNNHATLYNNPTWNNNSIVFDGETNYARIENTKYISFFDGYTLEVRMRFLSLGSINHFFGNWQYSGGGFQIYNSKLRADLYLNDSYYNVDYPFDWNIYNTLSIVYDNNIFKLYINGVLVNELNLGMNISTKLSVAPYALGGNPNKLDMDSLANVEFQGVRIYNRMLTNEEINQNYQIDISRYSD